MKDRLKFQTTQLSNGITLYEYPTDDPIAMVRVIIPVGSAHNANEIYPGSFHFLEHMVFRCSTFFPRPKQYHQMVEEEGGYFNAYTGYLSTWYKLETLSENFDRDYSGLIDHIFHPLFTEEEISHDIEPIQSERKMKEYWFPGKNAISQYIDLDWMEWSALDLRMRLGYKEDLEKVTPEYLHKLHNFYFNSEIKVIVGGGYNSALVKKKLEEIPTSPFKMIENWNKPKWKKKEFHTVSLEGTKRFLYYTGLFTEMENWQKVSRLGIILRFLTDSTNGPLFKWLREEKKYTYDVNYRHSIDGRSVQGMFILPFQEMEDINEVRKCLKQKIYEGLKDEDLIQKFLKKELNRQPFGFQGIELIMNTANDLILNYGLMRTEEEICNHAKEFVNSTSFTSFIDTLLSENELGECVIVPKN